jgi:hypothetical protein
MPDRRPAVRYPPLTKGDWIRGILISLIGLLIIIGGALYLLLTIPIAGEVG